MKNWTKLFSLLLFGILLNTSVSAQDELLDLLNEKEEPVTNYTIATFKNTRLISGHSVETNGQRVLQFLIGHRFGRINSGWRDLYGIDNATIRLGFDYGLTDNINIGFGRSSFQKTYDGLIKWKFLRQNQEKKTFLSPQHGLATFICLLMNGQILIEKIIFHQD